MLLNAFLFASTASATCLHGLSMFKRSTLGPRDVEVNTFGYGPTNGPFAWHTLAPENEACNAGLNQSPINIGTEPLNNLTTRNVIIHKRACVNETTSDNSISPTSSRPVVKIPEQSVVFENLGTTIEVVVNGTTSFNGKDFQLVQFHMHTPSEHHINDEYYPLEVHMVHQGVGKSTPIPLPTKPPQSNPPSQRTTPNWPSSP
jgi:carbonic anhydrase